MSRHTLISPSILAADFARLGEEIKAVELAGADWIHLDVMDGHFVPNISFGPPVIQKLRPLTTLPFDVHLMIAPVDPLLNAFVTAGADLISIHPEACFDPAHTLERIHNAGCKAGMVLNPETPLDVIEPFLEKLHHVLVMTVHPGFGGQKFMDSQVEKIIKLRRLIDERQLPVLIEVDGGINPQTSAQAREAGADVLVAGTSIFCAPNYAQALDALKR